MSSLMAKEAAQSPDVIEQQLADNLSVCQDLCAQIRAFDPSLVYIVGRGSSDHAGVFAKYLIEVELGIPVCSSAPSVFSVYRQTLKLERALVIIISQSGGSHDIIAQAEAAKASGAMTIAMVNTVDSPLAKVVDHILPIRAGQEQAIAATKSYLATLSAVLQLVAVWKQDSGLLSALGQLPEKLRSVISGPAQLSLAHIENVKHCVVLGRGFGYAISREIALKMKEVCGVHAEAFSSAEFLHGPVTLVEKQLSLITINIDDESSAAHEHILADLRQRGSRAMTLQLDAQLRDSSWHPRLEPLAVLQRFYMDIEQIAVGLGLDPDQPAGLKKVTITL